MGFYVRSVKTIYLSVPLIFIDYLLVLVREVNSTNHLRVDTVNETLVAGLLVEVVVPDESVALTAEGAWYPGVLVGDTPYNKC